MDKLKTHAHLGLIVDLEDLWEGSEDGSTKLDMALKEAIRDEQGSYVIEPIHKKSGQQNTESFTCSPDALRRLLKSVFLLILHRVIFLSQANI